LLWIGLLTAVEHIELVGALGELGASARHIDMGRIAAHGKQSRESLDRTDERA